MLEWGWKEPSIMLEMKILMSILDEREKVMVTWCVGLSLFLVVLIYFYKKYKSK